MKQPNFGARLPMKIEPLEVELEGWETMQLRVTLIDLQQWVQEVTEMSLLTQRHGNLYKFKEVL